MVKDKKDQINKNWKNYKCKPYILPFAGWLVGPSTVSNVDNFFSCIWTLNKEFFNILIAPFVKILEKLIDGQNSLMNDIQSIRKVIYYVRNSVEAISKDIFQRLYDTYKRIAYLVKKIRSIIYSTLKVFKNVFDVLLYAFYTLGSIWNGPIGKTTRYFCFDGDTKININGKLIKFKDVDINNFNYNNYIITKLKFTSNGTDMYNYNNIIVAGNHLVFENNTNTWKRVSELGKKINYNKDYIYCLITNTHFININNITFADYIESDYYNNIFYNKFLININNLKQIRYDSKNEILQNYLYSRCKIKMNDNSYKIISEINIGDKLFNNNTVTGIIKTNLNTLYNRNICYTKLYKYKDIIGLKNLVVNKDNKWMPLELIGQVINLNNLNNINDLNNYKNIDLYQICAENNNIYTKNCIFKDFELTNDSDFNSSQDDSIELYMNLYNNNINQIQQQSSQYAY